MQRRVKPRQTAQAMQVFEIEVEILGGPVTREFMKQNPRMARTILTRGDQTLDDLHEAIYDAFDRFDPHMYQFEIGGRKPFDRKARRYVMPQAMNDMHILDDSEPDIDATSTTIASLGLKPRSVFFYWFDFGDDWWHKLKVKAIHDEAPPGEYPQVTARVGESPPQYAALEEDEDYDWDDDDDDEGGGDDQ